MAIAHTWIEPSAAFESSLAAGETDPYRVRMNAHQSLRWVVEQRGVDVRLDLFDPDGRLLSHFDGPTHDVGKERGILTTETAGTYTLEVVSARDASAPGDYRLDIEYWGPASRRDRHLYRGHLLLHEAHDAIRRHRDRRALWHHVEAVRKALVHYESAGSRNGSLLARKTLADLLRFNGFFDASLELMRETIALQTAHGDGSGATEDAWDPFPWMQEQNVLAELHKQIGTLYLSIKAPERALGYFESAMTAEGHGERYIFEAVELLGRSYLELGDGTKALPLMQQLVDFWQQERHAQRQTDALIALGAVYESLDQPHEAGRVYERSLALARTSYFRPETVGLARLQVGRMQAATGHADEALETFLSAVDEFEAIARPAHRTLLELAKHLQLMGRTERAAEFYQRALVAARTAHLPSVEGAVLYEFAELLRREGRLSEALGATRAALEIAESVRDQVRNHNLRSALHASHQPFFDRHIELLMERHRQRPGSDDRLEAFETSERSRAPGLLQELADDTAVKPPGDANASDADRALRQRLGELLLADEAAVRQARLERRDLLNRLAEIEARDDAVPGRRPPGPAPLRLRAIREQVLDADTALLQYHLGERASHVWVVTTEAFTVVELPARRVIESAAQTLYSLLTARGERRDFESDAWRRQRIAAADAELPTAAARLGDLLLAPIASKLDRRRLMIVGDGILQSIPFAVLPLPADRRRALPLVVRHEIVSAPSSSVLDALRRRARERAPASGSLAVLADPVFNTADARVSKPRQATGTRSRADRGILRDAFRFSELASPQQLGRLPGTLREAIAIADLVRPEERFVAVGFEAHRDLALSGKLSDYRILHFASHALLGRDFPELSGIVLSLVDPQGRHLNGYLTVADIRHLEIAADLVVLSACNTALGKDVRGEGVLGLARGFLEAGATSVLASVWSPRDSATAEWMRRFYRIMLLEGEEPAAALRRAQISLWSEGSPPYFWGGFVLQGDWQSRP